MIMGNKTYRRPHRAGVNGRKRSGARPDHVHWSLGLIDSAIASAAQQTLAPPEIPSQRGSWRRSVPHSWQLRVLTPEDAR